MSMRVVLVMMMVMNIPKNKSTWMVRFTVTRLDHTAMHKIEIIPRKAIKVTEWNL